MKPMLRPIESVLLVEDSATQREADTALCKELGVRDVVHASDGAEALALLSNPGFAPCLMIVDLEMPIMEGVEMMQQLRQRGLRIPIIVSSGHDGPLVRAVEGMARNLGLPVIAGLCKPLARDELAQAFECCSNAERLMPCSSALPLPEVDVAALARAIGAGEVVPHYQPKVDIQRGLLCGVEVLARWTHARVGPVPADRFIAAAERSGLIFKLSLSIIGPGRPMAGNMPVAHAAAANRPAPKPAHKDKKS